MYVGGGRLQLDLVKPVVALFLINQGSTQSDNFYKPLCATLKIIFQKNSFE